MTPHTSQGEGSLVSYERPTLERLGTFRELTQSGGTAFSDMFVTDSVVGCAMNGSSSYTCTKP